VQMALHHELISVEPRSLREAVEAGVPGAGKHFTALPRAYVAA
jgi:hypothetical protein